MSNDAVPERRREAIRARVAGGQLPAALAAEEPTWIPSSYGPGGRLARCHFCGEMIGADEAILVRNGEQGHPDCEEAWRDVVTGRAPDKN